MYILCSIINSKAKLSYSMAVGGYAGQYEVGVTTTKNESTYKGRECVVVH
jgi:hypothetical protein